MDARVKHGHDGWSAPQKECATAGRFRRVGPIDRLAIDA